MSGSVSGAEAGPKKPFPRPVTTITGTAAMEMFCRRTGVSGNNIHAISRRYKSGHVVCEECAFCTVCHEYRKTKH